MKVSRIHFGRVGLIIFTLVSTLILLNGDFSSIKQEWEKRFDLGNQKSGTRTHPSPGDDDPEEISDKNKIEFPEDILEYAVEYTKNLYRLPPKKFDKWVRFAKDKKCSLSSSSYKRIEQDLQNYRQKHNRCLLEGKCKPGSPIISQEEILKTTFLPFTSAVKVEGGSCSNSDWFCAVLDEFKKNLPDMTIIVNQIDEPRVFKRKPTSNKFVSAFYDPSEKIWKHKRGELVDIMLEVCDKDIDRKTLESHGFFLSPDTFSSTDELLPVFSQSSYGPCFADILYPSQYYLSQEQNHAWEAPPVVDVESSSWKSKSPVFYWRGSNTGGGASPNNRFREFHRMRFVKEVRKTTVEGIKLDVGFSGIVQCHTSSCQTIIDEFGPKLEAEPISNSKEYKYLPDIDGNTFSQRSLVFYRATQSLVLKISLFEDWVTTQTEPYKHFLPVFMNLTNLEEQLIWARDHDKEAAKIALNAQKFAKERLRFADMQCYMFRLLLEYHSLTV